MVARMAEKPAVFALANPTPEILPDDVRAVAPDAIIATGRSDFPNQVNNVLCFPFIFRGALDVGATEINDEMQIACIEGIAALARATTSAEAAAAYQGEQLTFGRDYLIPKPFDPRLMAVVASAVAKAAIVSGVATRPLDDIEAYKAKLNQSVFRSALIMRPVFEAAATTSRRIVFAEGEDERVLRAAQAMLEETTDTPILIGRPEVIERRAERAGLTIRPSVDFELVNPENDPRYRDYWEHLSFGDGAPRRHPRPRARHHAHEHDRDRRRHGLSGRGGFDDLRHLRAIPLAPELRPATPWNAEASSVGALSLMILEDGPLFIADTHVHAQPSPEQIAETVIATARHVKRFGVEPNIALCSGSQFGNLDSDSGRRMRAALEILEMQECGFAYEGEMHVDSALDPELRARIFPNSRFQGTANALVFASTDAAGAARNILKMKGNGLEVGPILMGMGNRAHIVTPAITARGLLNISALAGTPVSHYG
jgi:malate dehydrogenase (oxaloacetate-decarboxylating)(NADP+)